MLVVRVVALFRILLFHEVPKTLVLPLLVLLLLGLSLDDLDLRRLRMNQGRLIKVHLGHRHDHRVLIEPHRSQISEHNSALHLLIRFQLDFLKSFQSFP